MKATASATIPASASWSPTAVIKYHGNAFASAQGGTTTVWFKFTPPGSAGWKIDDLYLDPRKGG